jgi:hypothetical protein
VKVWHENLILSFEWDEAEAKSNGEEIIARQPEVRQAGW